MPKWYHIVTEYTASPRIIPTDQGELNAQRGYMLNVALVIFLNYVASYKNVPSL